MLTLKLAFRTLMRRKGRMILIGALVAFGTILIVFGLTFSNSAAKASRESIIGNFTGDFIIYAAQSKELPSPFAFSTPLPKIQEIEAVTQALSKIDGVEKWTVYAQNYGIIEVDRNGSKVDLPYIFYAVDPDSYELMFPNVAITDGAYFGAKNETDPHTKGILVSEFQNAQYKENYGTTLSPGEKVKLLGVTEGGANTVPSEVAGIFTPVHYKSVFNYINFIDTKTYAELYNYTGVQALPDDFNKGLAAATDNEDSLFALAGNESFGKIDVNKLKPQQLSGGTMIAVRLSDHSKADSIISQLENRKELGIKAARWEKASGFYAQISLALQAFIFIATALIFLVVIMIFMNTLIINVVERTGEIGTMRAIGAEKSFIRGLFLAETLMLNFAAAAIGMIVTGIVLAIAGKNGIPLPETISQFLIGGGSLPIQVTVLPFGLALTIVAVVSVLATIYPVSVATSITPLKAMSDK